jgi:cell wall-associated NlpC family hydrolase
VLATVSTSASLNAVAQTEGGKWYRVKGSGAYGYVLAGDVDTSQVASSGSSSKVSAVLKLANEQLGDPYVYSAEGPDSFDCAGFVYYCFRNAAGVTLTRSAQSQGYDSSYEKIESISELKKGDVVCFNTNESDSDLSDHTAIYLGDGKFIHASSVGGKVMISSLSSGYYKEAFSWGLRILN